MTAMKPNMRSSKGYAPSALLGVALGLCMHATQLYSQGTAFTYQGRLNSGGLPYTGLAEFQPTLWDAATGGTKLADNSPQQVIVGVTNGLFVLTLDFGTNFPGADRWLQLEVRTAIGPFTTLSPRQRLTPTPYAITASSLSGPLPASQLTSTILSANLAGTYSGPVTFTNPANNFSGSGAGLTSLNATELASGTVPDARLAPNVARTNQVWLLSGNAGTTPGTHFVGTIDNQPLELRVNRLRALRLEPNGAGAPNVIGGAPVNFVAPGVVGATIAGGGATNYWEFAYINSVRSDFSTIGGGAGNAIAANSLCATVAGGIWNDIGTNAFSSFIGGGYNNNIADNSSRATIAGGEANDIGTNADFSFIGGGYNNNIATDSWYATIAGGYLNDISTYAGHSFIGGGFDNNITANSWYATIAGGCLNDIGTNAYYSFIGGGYDNNIADNSSRATIAGGDVNDIGTNADYSFIGGGYDNNIAANAFCATIPGGERNFATNYAFAAGRRAKANHT
ncbi:MAG: hypothetical protein RMH97_10640, partial [Verrucomicrobiales bacterium]|nr:hypothetical protein [Verrucomicrobiales bacterium]